jgi:adenine-specific DNA methylase
MGTGTLQCSCHAPARRGIVLDPFFGTGTVGLVAQGLGRGWLGIELNPAYAELARQRLGLPQVRLTSPDPPLELAA